MESYSGGLCELGFKVYGWPCTPGREP